MTPVTTAKEAIEAAADLIANFTTAQHVSEDIRSGVFPGQSPKREAMASAILRIPVADPVGVTVKPLEWQRNGNHWAAGHGYVIRLMGGRYTLTHRNQHGREFDALEEAQAAAQADYERRVLACLTVADDPRVKALVEALRNIQELNKLPPDDHGHRWDNSDLIAQECHTALAAFATSDGGE